MQGTLKGEGCWKNREEMSKIPSKPIHAKESIMVDGQELRLDVLELDKIPKRLHTWVSVGNSK